MLLTSSAVVALSLALHAQVTSDRLLRAADEPQNWLTYSGGYASQRHSLLKQIDPGNVEEPRAQMDSARPGVRRLAVHAARRQRDHVRHAAPERRAGARREDRPRVLAVPLHRVARGARVLRLEQPRRRHPRRHALHGHARRAPRRARRDRRPAAVERRGRRSQARLLDHDGAARRQGQGARRRRRRRVRHPRLHRGVRRADGQGSLALLHDSRRPASPAARRGRATRGRPAAARCG